MKNPPSSMDPGEVEYLKALVHRVMTQGYNADDIGEMYNLSTDGFTSWHKELGRLTAHLEATHRAITTVPPKKKMSLFKKVVLLFIGWFVFMNAVLPFFL